ncbi:hypothetical protein [Selenomonas infelix]|uniref:hypothetical protein n=1 Tax=Selenomonas infelix TaxID=135082 RepID=UPI00145E6081|nr:hypothetical protein [Selenomonas infelix]
MSITAWLLYRMNQVNMHLAEIEDNLRMSEQHIQSLRAGLKELMRYDDLYGEERRG